MKEMSRICLFLAVGLLSVLQAQPLKLGLQISGGLGAGWWVYNKGTNTDGWHNGYDRTHLAFSLPSETELLLQSGKWAYVGGFGMRRLVDNVMIASDHQTTSRSRYVISEETFLRFRHAHIGVGYSLVNTPRYSLIPTLRLGTFWVEHIHPASAAMGTHIMMDIALSQQWKLGQRWAFIAEGRYSDWRILGNQQALKGESHRIYTIDLRLGLLFWIISPAP